MKEYVVTYLEQYEATVQAENMAHAERLASGIRLENGARKLLSVREMPPPFPEERACPDCVEHWRSKIEVQLTEAQRKRDEPK